MIVNHYHLTANVESLVGEATSLLSSGTTCKMNGIIDNIPALKFLNFQTSKNAVAIVLFKQYVLFVSSLFQNLVISILEDRIFVLQK